MTLSKFWLAVTCVAAAQTAHGVNPVDLNVLLEESAGISTDDLRSLGDGFIVKQLDLKDPSTGLAMVGVVKLEADLDSLHAAMSRASSLIGPSTEVSIKALNVIAEPARDDEFAAYELTQVEKEALESCELGDCRMKLTEDLINTLRSLDYQWEDDAQAFTDAYRKSLTDLARGYQRVGNEALWVYRDKPEPLHALDGFKAALDAFDESFTLFPNVIAHLLDYPATEIEGDVEEFLFWSVLDFGRRPTLTVNHIVSIRPRDPDFDYVMVIKNIYANHYFGGRVTAGAFLTEGALNAPGAYLVLVDQLQFDGKLNRFLRAIVNRGIVSDMENRLRFIRDLVGTGPS